MTKKKSEDGTITLSRLKKKLPVKLTADGLSAAGVELANLLRKYGEFEVQATTVKKQLNTQGSAIQADIDRKAAVILSGVEDQLVEVEIRADYERGIAEVVRLDTGETLTKRTLSDEERQQRMVFEADESEKKADEAIATGEVAPIDVKKLAGEEEPKNLGDLSDEDLSP